MNRLAEEAAARRGTSWTSSTGGTHTRSPDDSAMEDGDSDVSSWVRIVQGGDTVASDDYLLDQRFDKPHTENGAHTPPFQLRDCLVMKTESRGLIHKDSWLLSDYPHERQ